MRPRSNPGFAEMSWRLVPVERKRRGPVPVPRIRLAMNDKTGYLLLNRDLRRRLNIDRQVEVLVNGRAIAVRAAEPGESDVRPMGKAGHVGCTDLLRRLGLRPHDSYVIDARVEHGHVWAELPHQMVMCQKRGAA